MAQIYEIWIGLHYWNKSLKKKKISFQNGDQNSFCHVAQYCWFMLITWKRRSQFHILFHQKKGYMIFRQLQRRGWKCFTRFKRWRKKRNLGYNWTPLMHLSVKKTHFMLCLTVVQEDQVNCFALYNIYVLGYINFNVYFYVYYQY